MDRWDRKVKAMLAACAIVAAGGARAQAQVPADEAAELEAHSESTSDTDARCVPPCRSGYLCHEGQCISACNPPCAGGEGCTAAGRCVREQPAGTAPGAAQPRPAGTEAGARAAPSYEAPGFSFLLRFGPTVGWFAGGHFGFGLAFRLGGGAYLAFNMQGGGGPGLTEDNAYATGGGGLSLRVVDWDAVGWVFEIGPSAHYLGEIWDGVEYEYVAPHAKIGGGVLFASTGRFAWGVEGTARLGYAKMTYNYDREQGYEWSDYSGFFVGLDISLVLSL